MSERERLRPNRQTGELIAQRIVSKCRASVPALSITNVIVLMLSAAGQEEENKSLEIGAMGFLPMPTTSEELIRIVSTSFRITNRFGTR